jgi:hypothetical protein
MVNMRNNYCNGQANNTNNSNPQMEQLLPMQNQLMQAMLQTLNQLQPNHHAQQQQQPPPPPPQSRLGEFLQTRPTTFSQARDPMEAEDWLKGVEKKIVIAQCTDQEKVLFVAHQLYGTIANWWEMYCDTHASVDTITWNEFKTHFRTHYVPRGTQKLKKKEFANLRQGNMSMNEYHNSFIQLARYAPDDINMDEKKQDMFLNGLNDDIQFQVLNTDYTDFQHMVDENKIKEMEKDVKRKVSFHGQSSGSNIRPCFSQPNQFFKPPQMNRPQMLVQASRPSFQVQRPQHQAPRPTVQQPSHQNMQQGPRPHAPTS